MSGAAGERSAPHTAPTVGAVSDEVLSLLEMPGGRLWVGTTATSVLRLSFPRDGQGGRDIGVIDR